jgi:hypothetical protein
VQLDGGAVLPGRLFVPPLPERLVTLLLASLCRCLRRRLARALAIAAGSAASFGIAAMGWCFIRGSPGCLLAATARLPLLLGKRCCFLGQHWAQLGGCLQQGHVTLVQGQQGYGQRHSPRERQRQHSLWNA